MRIIHTSDWHIGRRFEREPLDADQRAFLAWLARQVEEHAVALVVVAGDVYDRSMPAEDAVDVLDAGLEALRAAGAHVALIPGNHDSARRLGFGAARQALGGVHVFADVTGPPRPWRFSAGGDEVAVVAVPYLDPLSAPAPRPGAGPRTHATVLCDAVEDGRRALRGFGDLPTVAVAHGTVAGGWPSDSEKVLSIGGTDVVDAGVFDGFDYVALGHLHRPQVVAGDPRRCYSGSPLPYSFSETQGKSVRLVDLAGDAVAVRELPVPVGRPVATIEGQLDRLLDDPVYDVVTEHFVAARLTDTTTCTAPMERLRRRFPHVVSVGYVGAIHDRRGGRGPAGGPAVGRSPVTTVCSFLTEIGDGPPSAGERAMVTRAVEASLRQAPA